jgi:rSAM/selenodomain-associated transferase 1
VFAKRPAAGLVKTRLARATSPAWAAEVAAAFLQDSLDRLSGVEARRVLAFSPPEAESFFAGLARERFHLTPQSAGDLGQRMEAFFADELRKQSGPVVLVGTDSPTLPLSIIEQAFAELTRAEVVIGPATDGGYYLIGCARYPPPVFEGIAWGAHRVLSETVARLGNVRLALLPPWYDVDTIEDWSMLCGHLAALRQAGFDPELPHVERLIRGER